MNGFQLLGITLAAAFTARVAVAIRRHRIGVHAGALWLAIWVAAAAAIARPELTVVAARLMGIDRGADLVFYCAILAGFVGFFALYLKLRRLEQGLTKIVREIALREASAPGAAASETGSRAEGGD